MQRSLPDCPSLPSVKNTRQGHFALGKSFAESYTRQKALGVASAGKGVFAGCLLSGPRQKICRVPNFAECLTFNTRQRPKLCRMPKLRHSVKPRSLPSAKILTLGKASSNAECKSDGTQQIWYFGSKQTLDTQICRVCRVFWPKHPAKLSKIQFYFCF